MKINGAEFWTVTQGQGAPLVLNHGGPGGYDSMGPVSAMLDDLCIVTRYDQRGCGRSERVGPYTLEQYLLDLDGLREALGAESWMVGGHSWGANLSLAYALRYPHRVRGLVYMAGTGIREGWHDEYRVNRWAKLSEPERERWNELRRLIRTPGTDPALIPALDAEYHQMYMWTDAADRRNVPPPDPDAPVGSHEVNVALNAEWQRYAATITPEQLGALTCPALFVHGAADPRPAWPARQVAEAMPGARFVELPGVGHYVYHEEPHRLQEALRSFVQSLA